MQVSARTRRVVAVAAAGAPLVFCAGASAAWFNAGDVSGPAGLASFVTGPTAGQVAVAGLDVNISALGAGHAPGGAFGPAALLAAGSDDVSASIGPGGAIMAGDGTRPILRRLHADGSASAPVAFGAAESAPVGNAAVAPSGAALAVITEPEDGNVQIWRQPAEGAAPVQLSVPTLPDNASAGSVVPFGADGFIVVLSAANDDAGNGVRLRGLIVSGTSVGASRVIETSPTNTVSQIEAIAGPIPLVAYIDDSETADTLMVAQVSATPAPQRIDGVTGEFAGIDDFDAVATGTGGALAWSLSPDGESLISKYALLSAAGAATCTATEPFLAVAITDRGGPVVGGITADSRIGIVPAAPGCPAGTPQLSEPVPNAGDLNLSADSDGTLLAAVGRPENAAVRVLVDDITAPIVGAPGVPPTATTDRSFPATVEASDPWGLTDVTWRVDGEVVAHGTSVTIPGQPTGAHTVTVEATNAAGLIARSSATVAVSPVVVVPTATATPTPTAIPTTSPTPAPTAVPVARDTTAPSITDVRVRRDLFRPLARVAALPRGSGVTFALSEAATVRATILRGSSKRGGRSRCQVPPHGVPIRPLQGRRVLLSTRSLPAGTATLRLTGRAANGQRLPRGRYRVSLQATDAAGNRSEAVFIRFTLC